MTRQQLLGLGVSDRVITARVKANRLTKAHAGVYWAGAPRQDALAAGMAAVLACGEHAVLSHWSAGHVWGVVEDWRTPVHLTVSQGDRRPTGLVVHRCKTFAFRDARTHRGIRVTSPARTALDLAPDLRPRQLTRLVNDLLRRKLTRPAQLKDVAIRNRFHPGAGLLRPFWEDQTGATASPLEDLFVEFCHRHELPIPQLNVVLNGHEVDALFEAERVIVELDSWQFHSDQTAFRTDRRRDTINLEADYLTVRYTHHDLTTDAAVQATRLRTILDRRRHGPALG